MSAAPDNILEVHNIHTFIGEFHILEGVSVTVPRGSITVLLGRNGAGKTTTLRSIIGLTPPRSGEIRFNGQPVEHIAVIPGGGDNPRHLKEACDLGCDTYVTGHWWLQGDYEYAAHQREAMRILVPTLPMNLIGTSHYASEMVVMRDQMPAWFRNAGIEARFIKQPDPWR